MKKTISPTEGYANLMGEIKWRAEAIKFLRSGGGQALPYNPTTTESICLQIRKILELIAFSSLIANQEAYASIHKHFAKHWNAKFLLADLERVNPHFFPKPVVETRQGEITHCQDLTDGFLTKADFLHVYEKCGGMLHARNPYDSRNGYHYADKSISGWMEKIVNLLRIHKIQILGQEGLWLIHMHEKANDQVYVYQLEPVSEDTAQALLNPSN